MYKLQSDIVNQGLLENPYLRPHIIPVLNDQLNTIQKDSLIKAINEVFMKLNTMDNSLNTFMNELVDIIGNWKNDPELQDGLDLMTGSLISSLIYVHNLVGVGGLRRTVVFYIERFTGEETSIEVYVPYEGEVSKLYLTIPEESEDDLLCRLDIGNEYYMIDIPAGERFKSIDIEGTVDNESCIFTVLSGEGGVRGINASLDFIQSK